MVKINDILNNTQFRDGGFSVPDDYFRNLPEKIMDRIHLEGSSSVQKKTVRLYRPWMAWVSGMAAVLVIGWLGFSLFIQRPSDEALFQDRLQFLVEYSGNDLNEALLAGFIEEKGIVLNKQDNSDMESIIQIFPDQAEGLLYESIIY